MNKENMIKFMTELKAFCEENKECKKCELDDCCRIAFEKATLPFEWKLPDENKRWRAEKNGEYWYVNQFGVAIISREEGGSMYDDTLYYSHNYFRTKEEAEKYAKVLETEMLLRQFADEHNYKTVDWGNMEEEKWYMSYKYDERDIAFYLMYLARDPNTVYFNSRNLAREAVKTIGRDRVIEYLTYEW